MSAAATTPRRPSSIEPKSRPPPDSPDEDEAELMTALDASERSQLISLLQRVAGSQGLTAGVHPNL